MRQAAFTTRSGQRYKATLFGGIIIWTIWWEPGDEIGLPFNGPHWRSIDDKSTIPEDCIRGARAVFNREDVI